MSEDELRDRGPYLTESRTLALERRIAAVEARLDARLDELERQAGDTRAFMVELIRGQAGALVGAFKDLTAPRRSTGGR